MNRVARMGPACVFGAAIAACGGHGKQRFAESREAVTILPAGSTTSGMDIAEFQYPIDWTTLVADPIGIKFVFARATQGGNVIGGEYDDAYFLDFWPAMKSAGLIRGAYEFFCFADDGTNQADNFLNRVAAAGGFEPGDLPPMLDFEGQTGTGCPTPGTDAETVANAQAFVAEIQAKTGMPTIFYTDFGDFDAVSGTSGFSAEALWVADWVCTSDCTTPPSTSTGPDVKAPWSSWLFWQWSDASTIPGVGDADLDVFNGSPAQLRQYAGSASADGGPTLDAGTPDAGPVVEDAGPGSDDAGSVVKDAGPVARDAGPSEQTDSTLPPLGLEPDAGGSTLAGSGCSCSAGTTSPDVLPWLALAFGWVCLRRRVRHSLARGVYLGAARSDRPDDHTFRRSVGRSRRTSGPGFRWWAIRPPSRSRC